MAALPGRSFPQQSLDHPSEADYARRWAKKHGGSRPSRFGAAMWLSGSAALLSQALRRASTPRLVIKEASRQHQCAILERVEEGRALATGTADEPAISQRHFGLCVTSQVGHGVAGRIAVNPRYARDIAAVIAGDVRLLEGTNQCWHPASLHGAGTPARITPGSSPLFHP